MYFFGNISLVPFLYCKFMKFARIKSNSELGGGGEKKLKLSFSIYNFFIPCHKALADLLLSVD